MIQYTRSCEARLRPDVLVRGGGLAGLGAATAARQHEEHPVAPYDIAYRTLLPRGGDNLLVAGPCQSATSEALASSRLTATAMGAWARPPARPPRWRSSTAARRDRSRSGRFRTGSWPAAPSWKPRRRRPSSRGVDSGGLRGVSTG